MQLHTADRLSDYLRSSTWSDLYPEDRLLEAFGTINPTVAQRTKYFNTLWDSWATNNIPMTPDFWLTERKVLRDIGESLGLDYSWDFYIKDQELRTRTPELQALFILAMPDYIGQD